MSTKVRLPRDVKPVFPQRCVYSGDAFPDSEVGVVSHGPNQILRFFAALVIMFGWRKVRVPIARRHRARFYLQVYGRNLITLAILLVAFAFALPLFRRISSSTRGMLRS